MLLRTRSPKAPTVSAGTPALRAEPAASSSGLHPHHPPTPPLGPSEPACFPSPLPFDAIQDTFTSSSSSSPASPDSLEIHSPHSIPPHPTSDAIALHHPHSSSSSKSKKSSHPQLIRQSRSKSSRHAAAAAAVASAQSHLRPSTSSTGHIRKCEYCGTHSTPMWRHGPPGADPLCNSCGVKWKRGRILEGYGPPRTHASAVRRSSAAAAAAASPPTIAAAASSSTSSSAEDAESATSETSGDADATANMDVDVDVVDDDAASSSAATSVSTHVLDAANTGRATPPLSPQPSSTTDDTPTPESTSSPSLDQSLSTLSPCLSTKTAITDAIDPDQTPKPLLQSNVEYPHRDVHHQRQSQILSQHPSPAQTPQPKDIDADTTIDVTSDATFVSTQDVSDVAIQSSISPPSSSTSSTSSSSSTKSTSSTSSSSPSSKPKPKRIILSLKKPSKTSPVSSSSSSSTTSSASDVKKQRSSKPLFVTSKLTAKQRKAKLAAAAAAASAAAAVEIEAKQMASTPIRDAGVVSVPAPSLNSSPADISDTKTPIKVAAATIPPACIPTPITRVPKRILPITPKPTLTLTPVSSRSIHSRSTRRVTSGSKPLFVKSVLQSRKKHVLSGQPKRLSSQLSRSPGDACTDVNDTTKVSGMCHEASLVDTYGHRGDGLDELIRDTTGHIHDEMDTTTSMTSTDLFVSPLMSMAVGVSPDIDEAMTHVSTMFATVPDLAAMVSEDGVDGVNVSRDDTDGSGNGHVLGQCMVDSDFVSACDGFVDPLCMSMSAVPSIDPYGSCHMSMRDVSSAFMSVPGVLVDPVGTTTTTTSSFPLFRQDDMCAIVNSNNNSNMNDCDDKHAYLLSSRHVEPIRTHPLPPLDPSDIQSPSLRTRYLSTQISTMATPRLAEILCVLESVVGGEIRRALHVGRDAEVDVRDLDDVTWRSVCSVVGSHHRVCIGGFGFGSSDCIGVQMDHVQCDRDLSDDDTDDDRGRDEVSVSVPIQTVPVSKASATRKRVPKLFKTSSSSSSSTSVSIGVCKKRRR